MPSDSTLSRAQALPRQVLELDGRYGYVELESLVDWAAVIYRAAKQVYGKASRDGHGVRCSQATATDGFEIIVPTKRGLSKITVFGVRFLACDGGYLWGLWQL